MPNALHSERLFKKVLIEPAKEADQACIISGFATPSMAMHHLKNISEHVKVDLIVGMTPKEGIYDIHHKNFVDMMDNELKERFICSYLPETEYSVHSKIYVWLKQGKPIKAFCGSPNYTINAFKRKQIETITECNPDDALDFYKKLEAKSLYCNHQDASALCTKRVKYQPILDGSFQKIKEIDNNLETVSLPLYSKQGGGRMHETSGLNWGQRDGREPNQAYIPIPSKIVKSKFFPPRGEHFSVLTEEGSPLICVIAQDGDKAIHTPHNNSIIGIYFRQKLGVPLGQKVTLEDLDRFGNREVTFTKLDSEDYLMEFTSEKQK